jgi:hypothetical protein
MYDAYSAFDARELANERYADKYGDDTPDEIRAIAAERDTANEIAATLETERDALLDEVARLRDRCQVLILEKEEIRHTYQRHLGAYTRLAIDAMHEALAAGVIPEKLANDLNEMRRAA